MSHDGGKVRNKRSILVRPNRRGRPFIFNKMPGTCVIAHVTRPPRSSSSWLLHRPNRFQQHHQSYQKSLSILFSFGTMERTCRDAHTLQWVYGE